MAKPKFPLIIRRGAVTVKVYRTPLTVAARAGRKRRRRYETYTVVYTFAGRRVRKKFHDLHAARTEADKAVTDIANGEMGRRHLTEAESSEYLAAREALSRVRVGLLTAAHEYAEAKRDLPDVHLVQAVQFFKRYAGDKLARIQIADAVARFLAHKTDEKVGGYHLHDLDTRLKKFGDALSGDIAQVTTVQINAWLKALKVEPRTQNNYRAAVVQLFNFARSDLKALPQWLPHAAEQSIRVNEPAKDTEIYSPDEMRLILASVSPRLGCLIAIRAFSGIRNEELWRVEWEDFDLARGVIKLKNAVTKLMQRRVMPLLPNLHKWLERVPVRQGRAAEGYASAKTLSEAISNAIAATGADPRRNALRNSYTSYRLAALGEVGKVAEETGNSPAVIKREYLELTTPDRAAEWFSIIPAH